MVQPVPKQLTRAQKEALVEGFAEQIEDSTVVGILDMHALPAKQLQQIKKEMKNFADVTMSRKTLMDLAIEAADRDGIEELLENDAVQPAFIFSEKDAFQLYSLIQRNKTAAAAQGGEEAPNDIEADEGDTGIGPGPMLGELQQAGLQVQVQDGTIHITKPGVIVEKGDTITADDAEILHQLGIEPLEVGLDLKVAFAEGQLFTAEQLDIDVDKYRADVEAAAGQAFNLAVNAGIINERTVATIISESVRKARNLSISEGIPTDETIEEILAYAASNAKGVDSQVDLDSVDLSEESEEDEESSEEDAEEAEAEETEESESEDAEEASEDEDSEEKEE